MRPSVEDTFMGQRPAELAQGASPAHFRRCTFLSCSFGDPGADESFPVAGNAVFVDCTARGCTLGPGGITDVRIEGLRIAGVLLTFGTVFRRVELRGDIGDVATWPGRQPRPADAALVSFRERWYAETDWAIDIREARFKSVMLTGIPADLVRRDPARHAVFRLERLIADDWWRHIDYQQTGIDIALGRWLASGERDVVITASEEAPTAFQHSLEIFSRLRDRGLAE